jgi:gliding motility-associated-like protein
MRSLLLFACLCISISVMGQGSGFSFSYTGPTQILVGTSCMAPLNWGHPNTPTAVSNLPGGVIVSFNIYSISGGYEIGDPVMGGTTVTVFYQALDNFGNTALFGFTIVFIDLQPPVFDPLSLPSNVTISCVSNLPPVAMVEASDNCADEDPPLTITYTQTNNATLCTGGTVQRRWVADDDLGNTAQFIQTITVTADVTPPVITGNLVNGMAPCSTAMAQYTTWLNTQRANFTATDAGCGIMTLSDNAPPPAQITSFCGPVPVTFTATDNCNNTSTVMRTFTITNNVPPVITTPANGASGNCSAPNIQQTFANWIANRGGAQASDDCSSIFWTTFPASPSLADTCDAAIEVIFIAGDGCNNFDSTSASFVLIDDTPPSITVQPATMVLSCTAAGLDSTLMDWLVTGGHSMASDLCTPVNQLQLGYRINGNELTLEEVLAAWQDSLQSGCRDGVIINGIGINNVKALLEVRFTYDDNCDNEGGATGFFGITDNGRPVFDTLPQNLNFACSGGNDWMTTFNTWYASAGNADYSDACSDVTVHQNITADSAIAYLSAALDTACFQGVSVSIQFSLQDDCGNVSMATPSASFSLGDTIPPVFITPAGDYTAHCVTSLQVQLQQWLDINGGATASDGCGDLEWMFTWTDTSGNTQSGIPTQGPYPQVGDLGCNEAIDIIFTVTDICQNAVADTATFIVADTTAPVISIAEDTFNIACNDPLPTITATATDLCDTNPVITMQDSVSTDSCLGRPEQIIRTFIATDACGNSSSVSVYIFIVDTIAPTFDLPADTVTFCAVDTLTLLNVADNCDPAPVVAFTDEVTGPACEQTLLRTWSVTDACGNVATAIQSFDLSDEAAPMILLSPGHAVYSCDTAFGGLQQAYEAWQDSVAIADACSQASYFIAEPGSYNINNPLSWPGTPLPDSIDIACGNNFTIEADLVVHDECGNVVVETISFSVNDTIPPAINCTSNIIVAPDSTCTALVTLIVPATEETCFPDDVSLQLVINGGDSIDVDTVLQIDTVLAVGIHTAVWIATDCSGNIGTCVTTIGVIDEDAITISCPPDTLLYASTDNCENSLYVYAPATTTAGCGTGPAYWGGFIEGNATPDSFVFNGPLDSILVSFGAGLQQVFLVAIDSTGDIDSCKYLVDVRDTIAPIIICQSDTVVVSPSGLDTILISSTDVITNVSDACGIDTITYDPAFVTCSQSGQTVNITITVTDAGGNSSTCLADIAVVTKILTPTWSRGLCDDTLRLFANLPPDSLAGYSFSWSGPNGFMSTEENPVIPGSDNSFTGAYTLTVQSASGCTSSGSVFVQIEDLVSPVIEADNDTLCAGDSLLLTSQFFPGNVQYQWYEIISAGDSILLGSTLEPQFAIGDIPEGIHQYYAIVQSDTCFSAPGPVIEVFVAEIPMATIAVLPDLLCITDSLFLIPATIIDSLEYNWSGPGGYSSAEPTPEGIPATVIDSNATFTLVVSNQYCVSEPDSVFIAVQPTPATPVIAGDEQACEGGTIQLTASPDADNFIWIDPNGNTIPSNNDTLHIVNADTTSSGAWQVIAFVNGCPSDTSDAFTVVIDTAITVSIITDVEVCEGDSINLDILPALSGDFSWSGPGGFTSDEISPTVLAEEGIYSVSITTNTGCAATADIAVTVDELPVILDLSTDADTCANGEGSITIWAATSPEFSNELIYNWSGPQSFTVVDSSIVLNNVTSAFSGTYALSIVNGQCVSDTATIDLFLVDSPAPPVITGDNVYCFGDTIILQIQNPIDGATYTWSSNDTTVVVSSPGILVLPDATQDQTGVYDVFVTIAGCTSAEGSFGVQVRAPLAAPVISGNNFACEGDSLQLNGNGPAGATYQWSGPNGFASTDANPVISPVTVNDAGAYSVSYVLNGCSSPVSATFTVTVQAALAEPAIITDVTAFCLDAPIPINVCVTTGTTPGVSYNWILNGNTIIGTSTDTCLSVDVDQLSGGINSITAIATLQGCLSDTSAAVAIQADEIPNINADAGIDETYCPGEPIFLDGNNPSPGTGMWTTSDPLVFFENASDPNTALLPLPSGDFVVTWTLSYATCVDYSTSSTTISVITVPVTIPDTVSVPFGQTGEFIVTLNDMLDGESYTLAIIDNPDRGNALHVANGIIRYSPNIGFVGTDVLIYEICSRDCPEECSQAVVLIQVGNESDCFIPSLFTPNDDGINDVLIVPCLETTQFMANEIIIFNEWGDAVYKASPYLNDWDGTISGNPLPVGTYFYIMDFGDGSTPKRSFLIIER